MRPLSLAHTRTGTPWHTHTLRAYANRGLTLVRAFDPFMGALKCEGTRGLAGEAMLELQKHHVGQPAFHERWAVTMVELDDPAQAITHLQVAAVLYLQDGKAKQCTRVCRAGAALVNHLLLARQQGDQDWGVLQEVRGEFMRMEKQANEARVEGDEGAGRLHVSSI